MEVSDETKRDKEQGLKYSKFFFNIRKTYFYQKDHQKKKKERKGTGCSEKIWSALSLEIFKTQLDTVLGIVLQLTLWEVGVGDFQRSLPTHPLWIILWFSTWR